jgi:CO dehydrogenase maturation factor
MDGLSRSYEYVVMDNEAGLEHMSRRTTRDVDALLIVSDPAVRGIRTAERVAALADELGIGSGARYLVVNRASEPLDAALLDAIRATGVELLGVVPQDDGVVGADLAGVGLFELDEDSPALAKVREMVRAAVPALSDTASVS